MKIFSSLGHAFAWCIHHIVPGLKAAAAVAGEVGAVAASPIGTALASLAGPVGLQVQADIEAVSGGIVAVANASGDAFSQKLRDLGVDEGAIAASERLVKTVGGLFGKPAPAAANASPTA